MSTPTKLGRRQREIGKLGRREVILSVAAETFLTDGYSGTSMSKIAATLGGSKGTLWAYFSSKEELFEAALEHAIAAHHAQLSETLSPCDNLLSTLERFGINLINTVTSPRALALQRLVHGEAGRLPQVGEIYFRRATKRTREILADFLRVAMHQGLMRKDDPSVAARVFIALCMSGSHQELMFCQRGTLTEQDVVADACLATRVFAAAFVSPS